MKDYIEERAIGIANYIIESNATLRQTAKAFGGVEKHCASSSNIIECFGEIIWFRKEKRKSGFYDF